MSSLQTYVSREVFFSYLFSLKHFFIESWNSELVLQLFLSRAFTSSDGKAFSWKYILLFLLFWFFFLGILAIDHCPFHGSHTYRHTEEILLLTSYFLLLRSISLFWANNQTKYNWNFGIQTGKLQKEQVGHTSWWTIRTCGGQERSRPKIDIDSLNIESCD